MPRGKAGEKALEYLFNKLNWIMFRTQPETKTVWYKGKPKIVNSGRGGIADYTGYKNQLSGIPVYIACEVKEANGTSMPASRLKPAQRKWLAVLPEGSAYVGIFWMDTGTP